MFTSLKEFDGAVAIFLDNIISGKPWNVKHANLNDADFGDIIEYATRKKYIYGIDIEDMPNGMFKYSAKPNSPRITREGLEFLKYYPTK